MFLEVVGGDGGGFSFGWLIDWRTMRQLRGVFFYKKKSCYIENL